MFANAHDTRYHSAEHQLGADGIRSALLADERVVAMEAVRDAAAAAADGGGYAAGGGGGAGAGAGVGGFSFGGGGNDDDDNENFRDPIYDSGGEDDDQPADAEWNQFA